jgi:hypothetical protein
VQRFTFEGIAGRLCLGIAGIRLAKGQEESGEGNPAKTLCGRATRLAGAQDFIAVVDFDQDSDHCQGRQDRRFPRRSPSATNHIIVISPDKQTLACGPGL